MSELTPAQEHELRVLLIDAGIVKFERRDTVVAWVNSVIRAAEADCDRRIAAAPQDAARWRVYARWAQSDPAFAEMVERIDAAIRAEPKDDGEYYVALESELHRGSGIKK